MPHTFCKDYIITILKDLGLYMRRFISLCILSNLGNRDSVDRATGWTVQGLIPGRGKGFLSFPKPSKPALGLTQSPIQEAPGCFLPEVERLDSDVDHSPHLG